MAVGQARGVAEHRAAHAQLAGLLRRLDAELVLAAGDCLGHPHGDVVRRLGDEGADRILDPDGGACAKPQLRGRHPRGAGRNLQLAVQRVAALLNRLEQHVERHHLGHGGGIGLTVGVGGVEHLPGFSVDDDGCIAARIRRLRRCQQRNGENQSRDERKRSALHGSPACPLGPKIPLLTRPQQRRSPKFFV